MGKIGKREALAQKQGNALSFIRIIAPVRVIIGNLIPHMELSCPQWLSAAIGRNWAQKKIKAVKL